MDRLELLLFISALLAGLTGVVSGERRAELPQVERSAAQASLTGLAQIAAKAVSPALRVAPRNGYRTIDAFAAPLWPAKIIVPQRNSRLIGERRQV